eukprot:XP_027299031.1 uncharacterized protein LOC113839707 [Anas platyrhynchos]
MLLRAGFWGPHNGANASGPRHGAEEEPRVWLLSASTDRPCEQPGAISRLQSEQAPRRSPRKGDLAGFAPFSGGIRAREEGLSHSWGCKSFRIAGKKGKKSGFISRRQRGGFAAVGPGAPGRQTGGGDESSYFKLPLAGGLEHAALASSPPNLPFFLHREGGDVLGASRGEQAALGLFVWLGFVFFSQLKVSKSRCFQLVACITPGLKMHSAGLRIFASQEGHQAWASGFWSPSHHPNLPLVALQEDGQPSHEPPQLGAANVVMRRCSFWGERAKKPLFGFREKRRVRNAWGFLAWVSLQLSVLLPPSALISFFFFFLLHQNPQGIQVLCPTLAKRVRNAK